MTQRIEGGKTYAQVFDAENRLISVTVDSQITQFVYDGDGNMVKKIKPDGSYVLYIGSTLEIEKNSGGTLPTDKLFTGQRAMEGLGIYFYNARFYSPYLTGGS